MFSVFSGFFKPEISEGKDIFFFALKFVLRGDVPDGAMKADVVVMADELDDGALGIFQAKRSFCADTIGLDGSMPAFKFAIALRVMRRCFHMGQATDPDKLLEIFCNELRSVVRDDAWFCGRKLFHGALNNNFNIRLFHRFPQFPMNDETACSIQDGAKIIKCSADIEIGDINMPVLMSSQRLDKTFSLARMFFSPSTSKKTFSLKDPIDTRWTGANDVPIQKHKTQTPISFQGMLMEKPDDRLFFPDFQPVIPGNQSVVLVEFSITLTPMMVLA